MASHIHSDLEVVPQSENVDTQKYPYYSPEPILAHPNVASDTHKEAYQADVHEQKHTQAKTICGLRKKIFWILLVAAIVIVAGAVGGGVGGALASRSSSNKSTGAAVSTSSSIVASSSTTPTPTSSQTSTTITTTSVIGPSSTILRDCPSSNNSIYSVTTGATVMQFRKACELSYQNANGFAFSVARVVQSLDDCINICAAYNINNQTQIQAGTDRICNAVCWRNTFDSRNDGAGG